MKPTIIRTLIKFQEGVDGATSRVCGFVTKSGGSWKGCRKDDDCKKKIVFPHSNIERNIVPDILYRCSLVPMLTGNGFIARSATVVKFPAIIQTVSKRGELSVSVSFGNKLFVYCPDDDGPEDLRIQSLARTLRNRIDLEDAIGVAQEFVDAACMIKHLHNQFRQCK